MDVADAIGNVKYNLYSLWTSPNSILWQEFCLELRLYLWPDVHLANQETEYFKQILYCVGDIFLTETWGEATVHRCSAYALDEMPIHPKLPPLPRPDQNEHKRFFKLSYFYMIIISSLISYTSVVFSSGGKQPSWYYKRVMIRNWCTT